MHTFEYTTKQDGEPVSVYIHHNGDYSGDAVVQVQRVDAPPVDVRIPCSALAAFSAEAVRDMLLEALQDVDLR